VGYQLGILKSEAVSKDELQAKLGKDPKIASTRLGELVKSGTAVRTSKEDYRITTFGIAQIQKEALPKIKTRI
jgi:predicted transcriptional regulator